MQKKIAVLLHNVRSAHNVGSLFRTADASGVSKMYLTGYTPTPLDRFQRERKDIAKAALGAEKMLAWESARSPSAVISRLKRDGWMIVGVEQDARAVAYRDFHARGKTLFIFGNEVRGVPPSVLLLCDRILEIPMHGKKESLNVAVAAGIILFSCQ